MATADRPGWRTSSFSDNGQSCVEVDPGADWRTSSFTDNGQSCVEVATGPAAVRVRDTKDNGTGPILTLGPAAWSAFKEGACTASPRAGTLKIETDRRTTTHADIPRTTTWHIAHDGVELHFTELERVAFARGVEAAEFAFTGA